MCRVPSSTGRRLSSPSTRNGWEIESLGMWQVTSALRIAVRAKRGCGQRWRLVGDDLGHELARDRREADTDHRMTARRRQVREALEATDVGQAVRRTRAKSRPDRRLLEVRGSHVGIVTGD